MRFHGVSKRVLVTCCVFLLLAPGQPAPSGVVIQSSTDDAFLESVEKGDIKEVIRLLDAGVGANSTRQGDGSTALILAANKGHVQIAKLLINRGASVNASNRNGWTALMGAAMNNHLDVARLLIANKADVNARHSYGWTALKLASKKSHKKMIELLRECGAAK